MVNLPWTQNGSSPMITAIHSFYQERSLHVSSNCQSLAEHRNRGCRAGCDVCVANRPTTHNTNHLFSVEINGAKEPRG